MAMLIRTSIDNDEMVSVCSGSLGHLNSGDVFV